MDLRQIVTKILQKLNGMVIMYYYLALKVTVLIVIQKNTLTFSVKININENVESLNISNSAAIVFHFINQNK